MSRVNLGLSINESESSLQVHLRVQCVRGTIPWNDFCDTDGPDLDSDNEATTTTQYATKQLQNQKSHIQTLDRYQTSNALPALKRADVDLDTTAHSGKNAMTSSNEGILPPDPPPPIVARSYSSQPQLTRPWGPSSAPDASPSFYSTVTSNAFPKSRLQRSMRASPCSGTS